MEKNVPHVLSYTECLEIVQKHLKQMAQTHGRLKQWCKEQAFDYQAIVKIKNGSLAYYAPQLILKILISFGYSASITRKILSTQREEDLYVVEKLHANEEFPEGTTNEQ